MKWKLPKLRVRVFGILSVAENQNQMKMENNIETVVT